MSVRRAIFWYWGHLAIVVTFVVVGVSSAHMDALSDYRQETIYAEWAEETGVLAPISRFMTASHENREWIGSDWPKVLQSAARAVSDGWHVAKVTMLGAPVLLVTALVVFGYTRRLFRRWWVEGLVIVFGSYLVIGGTFFLFYHRLLHSGNGWWGF